MIRNLTAIGKTMLLPYLFILFLLVVPNTSFAQRKLNAAANTTKSSTSPKRKLLEIKAYHNKVFPH
jgi:hypothetical protein